MINIVYFAVTLSYLLQWLGATAQNVSFPPAQLPGIFPGQGLHVELITGMFSSDSINILVETQRIISKLCPFFVLQGKNHPYRAVLVISIKFQSLVTVTSGQANLDGFPLQSFSHSACCSFSVSEIRKAWPFHCKNINKLKGWGDSSVLSLAFLHKCKWWLMFHSLLWWYPAVPEWKRLSFLIY